VLWAGADGAVPSGGSGTDFALNPWIGDETLIKERPNCPGWHGYS